MQTPKTNNLIHRQIEQTEKATQQAKQAEKQEKQTECTHYFDHFPTSQMLGYEQCIRCGKLEAK